MKYFIIVLYALLLSACSLVGAIGSGEAQKGASKTLEGVDTYLTDSSITAAVKRKLMSLDSGKISVSTASGIVSLVGHVESENERQIAVMLAETTEGVREVRSQVQVRPKTE